MADIQQMRVLSIQVQDEEVDVLISVIRKILMFSKQSGFKKPFEVYEIELIDNIAEKLGLDLEKCNIDLSKTDKTY